jgi:uncharacterized protein (UPF0335 family)
MVRVRFDEGDTMSDPVGIAGERIRSFVERIEQLDTELREINEQKKEVLSEAKGEGFDVKILKEITSFASRTRTSATSTRPCSTSTCGPWKPLHPPPWLKPPKDSSSQRPQAMSD